mgnify:CR=1 FL=1
MTILVSERGWAAEGGRCASASPFLRREIVVVVCLVIGHFGATIGRGWCHGCRATVIAHDSSFLVAAING